MLRRFSLAALLLMSPLVVRAADNVVEIDGLKSKAPAAWKEEKSTSAMRKAQFKIEKVAGDKEDAELVIFFFGKGGGGSLDDNLKRWKSQFKDSAGEKAKVEKFKVGDINVTYMDISGTYLFKERPADPNSKAIEKPDFRALNVFFASPNGPYYFKLTGPAKTIEGQKKAFEEWVKNFK